MRVKPVVSLKVFGESIMKLRFGKVAIFITMGVLWIQLLNNLDCLLVCLFRRKELVTFVMFKRDLLDLTRMVA